MTQRLSFQDLDCFSSRFDENPKNLLALNAVTQNGIHAVALNRQALGTTHHTYSHPIETASVTHQEKTGRCWLFAGLNTLREVAGKQMKLENFELSQTYLMFWDKLEKANFFLENIIETRKALLNGRVVMWLLQDPLPDGGQWDMFVNLVQKYGVIPKEFMPETKNSSESRPMNAMLIAKLRQCAQQLRQRADGGASLKELRQQKHAMMEDIYRMLTIHLGKPPATIFWEWKDKDNVFHRQGQMTPSEFFKQYVPLDLDEMVCLIHAPTKDKPFNRLYTVQYLGNVVEGYQVRYLNAPMEVLKQAAVEMIVAGEPVWFGCDVGKRLERDRGLMDLSVYNYELVYDTSFALDKAERLDYGHSSMTHAMVLTGVDLNQDKKPLKWRVENSWGDTIGDKGYMMMSDDWFDEYLYEISVKKSLLAPELLNVLKSDPVVLPPWDPMGALAKSA